MADSVTSGEGRSMAQDLRYSGGEAAEIHVNTLALLPTLKVADIGREIETVRQYWSPRGAMFRKWDKLLTWADDNVQPGLESMVANSAKTLFSLAQFMVASIIPQRTVAIGGQGPVAQRRAGKSERATVSWWEAVDFARLCEGRESFQYEMAYWMCLYGWYAALGLTVDNDGEPEFVAVAYDPSECYPEYADGLRRFSRLYDSTLGEAKAKSDRFGSGLNLKGDSLQRVQIGDWYWLTPANEVLHAVLLHHGRWQWLKEPDVLPGLSRIPVYCGPVGGTPRRTGRGWMTQSGSVFVENERLYKDFNKWLSFLLQMVKEHVKAPILTRGIHIEKDDIHPLDEDIRTGSAVLESDDPEARIDRIEVGASPIDVFRILGFFSEFEQRGGFSATSYGSSTGDISGFAISQLLQSAERRIGLQVTKLALVDGAICQRWLEDYRDATFASVTISGSEGGNPRKSFIEEFKPRDVPKRFRASTAMPIRIANDLMSRMAIARQALGGTEQILDMFTTLDEVLQMQDPTLILDRISDDRARMASEQLRLAFGLKTQAMDMRASGRPGAEEAAKMMEMYADTLLQQQRQAMGAQPSQRIAPEELPQEARGQSPDRVRAQLRMGPPPNRTAQEQATGVQRG